MDLFKAHKEFLENAAKKMNRQIELLHGATMSEKEEKEFQEFKKIMNSDDPIVWG